jgi:hypothetical protein
VTEADDLQQRVEQGQAGASRLLSTVIQHKKSIARLEKVLKGLKDSWGERRAMEKTIEELQALAGDFSGLFTSEITTLEQQAREWSDLEGRGKKRRLLEELEERSQKAGLRLICLSKDPLELRLVPFGVLLDFEKSSASLTFGKIVLSECSLESKELIKAHTQLLAQLESQPFDPEQFHGQLKAAWQKLSAKPGHEAAGWVELSEILPLLALGRQDSRWRFDPTAKHYKSYGKAQFLYDLYRLRQRQKLTVDGWRLSLGVATGGSPGDKKRLYWLEDAEGHGTYQATLRFGREEEISGGPPLE